MTSTLSRRDLCLLALLTLFWGVNWPVLKYGVREYPPLSLRWLSMLGGLVVLGAYIRWRKQSLRVPTGEWGRVFALSIPNMVVWHVLAIYGVKYLASGRAALLGYTMPIWAVLIGALFYQERISGRMMWGVACALLATLLLLAAELTSMVGRPLGVALMLSAAAAWGLGTIWMKRWRVEVPTATLTFWTLFITLIVAGGGALVFERHDWRMPTTGEWLSVAFNAVVVFGYCHVVWFYLARSLPPVVSGLSIMLVPVVGVFSGAWTLGEVLSWRDYTALGLVLFSLFTVLIKPR